MRIAAVEVHLVDVPAVDPPFRWRAGLPGSEGPSTGAYLRVVSDGGLEGVAWCRRGVILKDVVDRRIRSELVGADPLQRERLWHRMWELDRIEEFPLYIPCLVDIALWDMAARAAHLPVHRLLGGFHSALPAYASTVTFGSIDEYLDVADQCLALGYPAIKLHAWGDSRQDARLIAALREHVGDEIPLMYDGSAGFDLADAIYVGRALSESGYLWYEEPMREFNIWQYARLSERVDVPLLVAETADGAHYNMADWVASGCATFVRTESIFKAGITGGLRVAHLAEAFGLRAEVHGGGLVNAHLALSIPNTTYYESMVRTNPVQREELVGADGHVRLPTEGEGFCGSVGPEPLPWLT